MVESVGKALVVLAVAVLLIYTFFWLRAGRPRPGGRRRRPAVPPRPPVVGPDDDPDFLRKLKPPPRREIDEDPAGG